MAQPRLNELGQDVVDHLGRATTIIWTWGHNDEHAIYDPLVVERAASAEDPVTIYGRCIGSGLDKYPLAFSDHVEALRSGVRYLDNTVDNWVERGANRRRRSFLTLSFDAEVLTIDHHFVTTLSSDVLVRETFVASEGTVVDTVESVDAPVPPVMSAADAAQILARRETALAARRAMVTRESSNHR